MMAGGRLEGVAAVSAAGGTGRSEHDRRTLVMRLVSQHARRGGIGVLVPGPLEFGTIALRAIAIQKFLVVLDAGFDEILGGFLENGTPFLGIGCKQRVAAPALEFGGELPAEIDHVVEPIVEAISAVRRMRMGCVAGNENAADLVFFGDRDAQIPKADIIEITSE